MQTPQDETAGSLIVFGWTASRSLRAMIAASETRPRQVLLVGPVAAEQEALSAVFSSSTEIAIIDAMPSGTGATDAAPRLVRYSVPGMFGAGRATEALRHLYPGLKVRAEMEIAHIPVAEMAAAIPPLPDPLVVVIDAPGAEASILEAMDVAGLLTRARAVSIRCGADVFFSQGLTADAVQQRLSSAAFVLAARSDEDPDWPELHFRADLAARRMARLEARLQDLEAENARHVEALAESETARQALGQERDAAREEVERLKGVLDETRKALETTKAESETARQTLGQERDAAREEVERLKGVLDETRKALETTKAESETARQALGQERDAARDQLALAQRLHLMAVNDLQFLRSRHEEAVKARQELESVMRQLVGRLREAQAQLRELFDEPAEVLTAPEDRIVVVAPPGDDAQGFQAAGGKAKKRKKKRDKVSPKDRG